MSDDKHELVFGSFLTPSADRPDRVVALARLCEQLGLDLVSVQDHPCQSRFLDTWTLLSVIAARTERIAVVPNVINLPLRPPVVLARSAATLDLLTGGRVELGLGAGAFWDAIDALGGPRRNPGEAVEALAEAVIVIRAMWAAEQRSVHIDGRHYRVSGAHPGPAPAHPIGIWLGSYKPRMLALTGEMADGWLPSSSYATPEQLPAMSAVIDEAAANAGRRPADVRRIYNISGRFERSVGGFLDGPPEQWVEQLAELSLKQGMGGYILASDDPDTLRRFADEVVPEVRKLVTAERAVPLVVGPAGAPSITGRAARELETPPNRLSAAELRAAATPDDGVRLSEAMPWDETTRPHGPDPDPGRTYSPEQRSISEHLVAVHDHLRSELQAVRQLVEEVLAGRLEVRRAREQLMTMTLRQNDWAMGAYCAAYCRLVTTHHTVEDRAMLPHLRRADPRLAPVIDRLQAEHEVIHEVIEGVDRALVHYLEAPESAGALRKTVDLLTDTMVSHLSYEERELMEPLAAYGFY